MNGEDEGFIFVEVDWAYGVNPLLVKVINYMLLDGQITEDLIKVVDENSIIILNHPDHAINLEQT